MDKRTRARELTLQAICQMDVQGSDALDGLGRFFRENSNDELVLALAGEWSHGVWEHLNECDELIAASAVKWELGRLSQVDRCILRLGAYQLKFCPAIPDKVAINEAIELAKKYSSQTSAGFVNGVLDAILKKTKN
ncbi:MAG: transcription antitermination factor NusB [Planctomycetes bacterium]|nr:transcription antitermination factor NusB [Planctomycetota bacterium]